MALTLSQVKAAAAQIGSRKMRVYTVTLDSSYNTGGEALAPKDVGLKVINSAIPNGPFRKNDGTSAVYVSFDHTNNKLLAYWGNAGTASVDPEVTSTTDLSTYSGRITFIGR